MNKRELSEKYQKNLTRISEIANACEAEKRNRTEAEETEYVTLCRENELYRMKMQALDNPNVTPAVTLANSDSIMRDAYKNKFDVKVVLTRDIMSTAALANTGIIPVSEQEMLSPLRAGLIWAKMGLTVLSGLSGTLRWPSHSKATATWEGETSRLVDSNIDFRALTMAGHRLGLAIPVSKKELFDSHGIVERVVREEMPAACQDTINAAILDLVADIKSGENVVKKSVVGPFAQTVNAAKTDLSGCEIKTLTVDGNGEFKAIRRELLQMKAAVYGAGVQRKNPGYVMNENTKTVLEDTKVDAGSGRFVCENDMVLGCPVFTSNEIPDGVIGFGDWSYQAAGFFGETSLVVDPYTLARQNSTDFVLNMGFGTATLRKEAFILGMTASAKTALLNRIKALYPDED